MARRPRRPSAALTDEVLNLRTIPFQDARLKLQHANQAFIRELNRVRQQEPGFDAWFAENEEHYASFASPGDGHWHLPQDRICHTLYVGLAPVMAVTTLVDGKRFYHIEPILLLMQVAGSEDGPAQTAPDWLICSEVELADLVGMSVPDYIKQLMALAHARMAALQVILTPDRPVRYRLSYARRGSINLQSIDIFAYSTEQVTAYAEARGLVIMNIEELQ